MPDFAGVSEMIGTLHLVLEWGRLGYDRPVDGIKRETFLAHVHSCLWVSAWYLFSNHRLE